MDTGLIEGLGYAAAGLVLATFAVRSIKALRSMAIASNLMFMAYAASAQLLPVLCLHALLLPLNLWRLREATRAPRREMTDAARRRPRELPGRGRRCRKTRT